MKQLYTAFSLFPTLTCMFLLSCLIFFFFKILQKMTKTFEPLRKANKRTKRQPLRRHLLPPRLPTLTPTLHSTGVTVTSPSSPPTYYSMLSSPTSSASPSPSSSPSSTTSRRSSTTSPPSSPSPYVQVFHVTIIYLYVLTSTRSISCEPHS